LEAFRGASRLSVVAAVDGSARGAELARKFEAAARELRLSYNFSVVRRRTISKLHIY